MDRQKTRDAVKNQKEESKETLLSARARLTTATSKLRSVGLKVDVYKKEATDARVDVALQTLLREGSREQLNAKVAEFKEM